MPKKTKKSKPKSRNPETIIEIAIMDLTHAAPKAKGEARLDYLCRLAAAADPKLEESQALPDRALSWAKAFMVAPDVLEPRAYLDELGPESEPEEEPREERDPSIDYLDDDSVVDDGKAESPPRQPVTSEFRKLVIENPERSFLDLYDSFQFRIGSRSAATVFYNTRSVVSILKELGHLSKNFLKKKKKKRKKSK